jgi:hypothetical protein
MTSEHLASVQASTFRTAFWALNASHNNPAIGSGVAVISPDHLNQHLYNYFDLFFVSVIITLVVS